MSGGAIIMMLIATGTVWGGLAIAITNLVRNTENDGGEFTPDA